MVGPGKQPDHRLRILDVVADIGERRGLDEIISLAELLYHRAPRVRQKVLEVSLVLGPPWPPSEFGRCLRGLVVESNHP